MLLAVVMKKDCAYSKELSVGWGSEGRKIA